MNADSILWWIIFYCPTPQVGSWWLVPIRWDRFSLSPVYKNLHFPASDSRERKKERENGNRQTCSHQYFILLKEKESAIDQSVVKKTKRIAMNIRKWIIFEVKFCLVTFTIFSFLSSSDKWNGNMITRANGRWWWQEKRKSPGVWKKNTSRSGLHLVTVEKSQSQQRRFAVTFFL